MQASVTPPQVPAALFARSLELSGYVVIECDAALGVLAQHGGSESPVRAGRLLPELEAAVQAQLRTSPYARTGAPEFRLVQVDRNADGTLLVWLRHHAQSRALFSRQLRERYGFKLRSQQLLTLLAQGLKNREIAEQLGLREATVKTYLHEVYETLGVKSRTQAIAELRRTVQLESL
jgi:DNA-binding NarL/FixJ family response regulator